MLKFIVVTFILSLLSSCGEISGQKDDPRFPRQKGENQIRLSYATSGDVIEVLRDENNYEEESSTTNLESLFRISPPRRENGDNFQATSTAYYNNISFITYNLRGDDIEGWLDVVTIDEQMTVSGLSSVSFPNYEFSEVMVHNGMLYLAGQKRHEDTTRNGVVLIFDITINGTLTFKQELEQEGFYSNSIVTEDDLLFVGTGDNEGVSIYRKIGESYLLLSKLLVPELLSIVADSGHYRLLHNVNGQLIQSKLNLDLNSGVLTAIGSTSGMGTGCFAPTRMATGLQYIFTLTCNGMLMVEDTVALSDFNIQLAGTLNSVMMLDGHLIVAAGEAGVHVYNEMEDVKYLGKFDFKEDFGSANYVNSSIVHNNNLVSLSDGLSGTTYFLFHPEEEEPPTPPDPSINQNWFFVFNNQELINSSPYSCNTGTCYRVNSLQLGGGTYSSISESASPDLENGLLFKGNTSLVSDFAADDVQLFDDDYFLSFLLNLSEYPNETVSIFSSEGENPFVVLLTPEGRIEVWHGDIRIFASDTVVPLNKDILASLLYRNGQADMSYMYFNDQLVAQSTAKGSYNLGKLYVGANQFLGYGTFNGLLKLIEYDTTTDFTNGFQILTNFYNPPTGISYSDLTYDFNFNTSARLVTWLDSTDGASINKNGTNLISWQDKSPKNLTYETYKGSPLVDDDGAILLDGSSSIHADVDQIIGDNSGYTKIIVFSIDSFQFKNNLISSGVGNNHALYLGDSPYPQLWHNHYRFAFSEEPVPLNEPVVVSAIYGAGSIDNQIFINSVPVVINSMVRSFSDPKIEIGSHGGFNFLKGKVFEVIILDDFVTNHERLDIENYLIQKYNIQTGN
jgi:hypothetical protein